MLDIPKGVYLSRTIKSLIRRKLEKYEAENKVYELKSKDSENSETEDIIKACAEEIQYEITMHNSAEILQGYKMLRPRHSRAY